MIACRNCGGQKFVNGALCPSCKGAGFFGGPDVAPDPITPQLPQLEATGLVEQLIGQWRSGASPQQIQAAIAQSVPDPSMQSQILQAVTDAVSPQPAPPMAESGAGYVEPYLPPQPQQPYVETHGEPTQTYHALPPAGEFHPNEMVAAAPPPPPVQAPAPVHPTATYARDTGRDKGAGVTATAKSYELETMILAGGIASVPVEFVENVVAAQYVDQMRSHRPNVRAQAAKNLAAMFGIGLKGQKRRDPKAVMREATAPEPAPEAPAPEPLAQVPTMQPVPVAPVVSVAQVPVAPQQPQTAAVPQPPMEAP